MPNQRNLQWYTYLTNRGQSLNIMADKQWGDNAASGLTAFSTTQAPFGPQSTQHRTRKAVYQDPQTFRTVVHPVGTPTAFASVPSTINVDIVGSATPVSYALSRLIEEKMRLAKVSRPLADHTSTPGVQGLASPWLARAEGALARVPQLACGSESETKERVRD